MSQINHSLGCFAVYADALIHHEGPEYTSHDKEEGVVHRRMSLPESKGQNEGEDKRSSTGEYCVPITTPLYPGVQSVGGGMYNVCLLSKCSSLFANNVAQLITAGTEHELHMLLALYVTILWLTVTICIDSMRIYKKRKVSVSIEVMQTPRVMQLLEF